MVTDSNRLTSMLRPGRRSDAGPVRPPDQGGGQRGTDDAHGSESGRTATVTTEHGLFGGDGEAPSRPPPPRRRGRGAVPVQRYVVTLPEPNPAGRRTVTFEYRPLLAWAEQRLVQVRELLTRYFAKIGGCSRADDTTVRVWHDALMETFTADELRWAIDAKAASLIGSSAEDTRDRRRYAAHPGRFIASGAAGYWLSQSPEYHARQQAQRAADGRRLGLALAEVGRVRRSGAERLSAGGAGGSDLAAAERAAEARRAAFWLGLRPVQRMVALGAVRPTYKVRCRQWNESPDDPKLAPTLLGMAIEWARRQWPRAAAPTSDLFGFDPNSNRH